MLTISIFMDGAQVSEIEEEGAREISIGRAPGCIIRLPDVSISRLHATLRLLEEGWKIEKESTSGSLAVNGTEVENAILHGGEEIVVGAYSLRINIIDEKNMEDSPESPAESESNEEDSETKVMAVPIVGCLRFEAGVANRERYEVNEEKILIGRASTCNIIINEKKASRKHFEVWREGIHFYIKDLDSANKTFVNDNPITKKELVTGDIIQVGDIKIEFTGESKEFFEKEGGFSPVPEEAAVSRPQSPSELISQQRGDLQAWDRPVVPGVSQEGNLPAGIQEKSLLKRRWQQFKGLPKNKRLLIIFIAALLSIFLFNNDEEVNEKQKKTVKVYKDKSGKIIRTYETLNKENKKIVLNAYKRIILAREKSNYEKMQDNLSKIFRLISTFKDARIYQEEARLGIERREEELDQRRRERIKIRIQKEVEKTVKKLEKLFQRALKDPSLRSELERGIEAVFVKDPNNQTVQVWQEKIQEKILEERKAKILEIQRKKLEEEAEGEFKVLEELVQKEEFIKAMAFANTLSRFQYSENRYMERVTEKKKEARDKLDALINPLLEEADKLKVRSESMVKSGELYRKVLKLESSNQRALSGLGSIRSALHLRAKQIYAQAVLAESISSLDEARQKFELCLKVAPEGDNYKRRCRNKLTKYEAFPKEEN